jgi:hypothetical protein
VNVSHSLLLVLDELVLHSTHYENYFVELFLKSSYFKYLKQYSFYILLDILLEKEILSNFNGHLFLKRCRIQIVKHFKVLFFFFSDLLNPNFSEIAAVPSTAGTACQIHQRKHQNCGLEAGGEARLFAHSSYILLFFFSFHCSCFSDLTITTITTNNQKKGCIFRFLTSGSPYDNFSLKKMMLEFLYGVFTIPESPFINNKTCIDSYIRYAPTISLSTISSPSRSHLDREKLTVLSLATIT